VHRDIKPENVVLSEGDVARLCDFGMATQHGNLSRYGNGTMRYMAPELAVVHNQVTCAQTSQDVWSLGVLVFVMLTKFFPWDEPTDADPKYTAFMRGDLASSKLWSAMSPEFASFMRERVFVSADKRCDASELRVLLEMPWLASSSRGSSPTAKQNYFVSHWLAQELAQQLIVDALGSPQEFIKVAASLPDTEPSKDKASPSTARKNVFRRAGRWSLKLTNHIVKTTASPLRRSLRADKTITI
jgi:serine/threonine protein kinase